MTGVQTCALPISKTTQIATRRYISVYFTQLKDMKPLLKGSDLIQMGMKPGPSVRRVLTELLKHMQKSGDAWFTTHEQLADWTLKQDVDDHTYRSRYFA